MCDTVVLVTEGRVLFAKNSDRDPNEAQLLEWRPRGEHPPGARVRCTWTDVPQARRTHAVLLSRPFWMWGAEMGANEHGVVAGNQAVFTRGRVGPPGLTGMDLLRLGLERAESARGAVEAIIELLERHGQGGACGHEDPRFAYHSSFLVADARGAVVLETAGRWWAAEDVAGARSLSNALSIPGFAERHSDVVRTWAAEGRIRRALTCAAAERASGASDLMRLLRRHGRAGSGAEATRGPAYRWLNGAMSAPCVHAGGLLAAAQTTASWVSELTAAGARHWATATAAPCTSIFKPVAVDRPLDLGPAPTDRADERSLYWRHERLHRLVLADPERRLPFYAPDRDALEARWLESPPDPAAAFALGDERLAAWTAAAASVAGRDVRPWYARRYWRLRDRRAGLAPRATPASGGTPSRVPAR